VKAAAPRIAPRSVTIRGRRILVDDDQPTFWDRVEAGLWEPGTLSVLETLLGPDIVFVDVGAWVGALTLYAAALGARVVAVEADPKALDQLRRNLAANPNLSTQVTVIPRALSPDGEPVRLGARRKPGDSMSSALLADAGPTWIAEATTSGSIITDIGTDLRRHLKLDIEGGEYAVLPTLGPLLAGAEALLLALHPDILAESGVADVPGATARALEPLRGWTCARIGPDGLTPASMSEIPEAGPAEWLFTREAQRPALASS
jgi:FkbM family methyltransferase